MAWLQNEKGAQTVEDLLRKAKETGEKLLLHEINLAEVYYLTIRRAGDSQAKTIAAQMETLPIEIVRTTPEIMWQAARLKAQHKLSLADTFAAGTAMQLGVRIVTGDPEFKSISHMVEILWL